MWSRRSPNRPDTAAIQRIRSLAELARLVSEAPEPLYLRYSKGPDADSTEVSRDYESGLELPGLSVNPLNAEKWWTRPITDWLARQICNYIHLNGDGRSPWVLCGEVVACGPDNEPLLASVRHLAVLTEDAVREANVRYHARFQVGRDSTD
jgi:Family of unknown function (DUF6098)